MSITDDLNTEFVSLCVDRNGSDVIITIRTKDEYEAMLIEDKFRHHLEHNQSLKIIATKAQ